MKAELRAVGAGHGLLLGLVLASPLVGAAWLPHGVDALFAMSAFQLRLADRRWTTRPGLHGWISHIRMAPARLFLWAIIALVTMMAGDGMQAFAVASAAVLCELLIYPVAAPLLGRLSWRDAAMILLAAIGGCAVATSRAMHLMLAFTVGVAACMVWLRGPDGDGRAMGLALTGAIVAVAAGLAWPASLAFAWPTGVVCAIWTLAYLSVLRRRPLPWRSRSDAGRFKPC